MSVQTKLTRRHLLRGMGLAAIGAGLAACAPKVVEKVVKETVEVEKIVKETVAVEKVVEKVITATPAPLGEVTVNMFARSGDIEVFERQLTLTNWYEEHPMIEVNSMGIPSEEEYWTKILTMAAGGIVGSVFWSSIGTGGFQQFAIHGLCLPLNPLSEADDNYTGAFFEGAVSPLTFDGTTYALPRRIHPGRSAIWYNADMFAEAGVAEPTDDWTYEDLVSIAQKLTEDVDGDGRIDNWGFVQGGKDMLHHVTIIRAFEGWALDHEGKTCLLNTPESMAALTWVYDTMYKHECQPSAAAIEKSVEDMYLSGSIGMQQLGWWGRFQDDNIQSLEPENRFETKCVGLPKSPTGKRGSMFEINCISIASAIRPEIVPAAWELMKGLTSVGVNIDIVDKLFGGARKSALQDALDAGIQVKDYMYPVYTILDECMEFRMCWNWRSSEYNAAFNQGLDPLWLDDEQPTKQFFDRVTREVQDVLDLPMAGEG